MIKKLTIPILSATLLFGAGTLSASAMLNQAAPVAPAITAAQLFDEFTTQDPALITHLEIYIANNGNINKTDNKGRTLLHLAIQNRRKDIAEWLVNCGADVNATDNDGKAPIHIAVDMADIHNLNFLITQKMININAKDSEGFTPLHLSLIDECEKTAMILINAGADVNATSKLCVTPLHIASFSDVHMHVVEALIKKGAIVGARDAFGQVPLHHTMCYGKYKRSTLLAYYDPDLENTLKIKSIKGQTPEQYGLRFGRYDDLTLPEYVVENVNRIKKLNVPESIYLVDNGLLDPRSSRNWHNPESCK